MLDMFLLLRIMNLRSGTIINQNATCSSGFNQPSKKTLLIQSCKKDMSPMTLMLHELLSHHLNVNYNVFVGNANIIYKIINYEQIMKTSLTHKELLINLAQTYQLWNNIVTIIHEKSSYLYNQAKDAEVDVNYAWTFAEKKIFNSFYKTLTEVQTIFQAVIS